MALVIDLKILRKGGNLTKIFSLFSGKISGLFSGIFLDFEVLT